jgi:hypothetical protein
VAVLPDLPVDVFVRFIRKCAYPYFVVKVTFNEPVIGTWLSADGVMS